MKAHDVRHLVVCETCKQLGDDRNMVYIGEPRSGLSRSYWHGLCFIEENGVDVFLELNMEVLNGIRLNDIGVKNMKKILALAIYRDAARGVKNDG